MDGDILPSFESDLTESSDAYMDTGAGPGTICKLTSCIPAAVAVVVLPYLVDAKSVLPSNTISFSYDPTEKGSAVGVMEKLLSASA